MTMQITAKETRDYTRFCLDGAKHLLNGWEKVTSPRVEGDERQPRKIYDPRWISGAASLCSLAFTTGLVNGELSEKYFNYREKLLQINGRSDTRRSTTDEDVEIMTNLLTGLVKELSSTTYSTR